MICSKCNRQNKEGSQFCSYCGNSLVNHNNMNNNVYTQNYNSNNNNQSKKSSFTKGQLITIGILLVVAVASISVLLISGKKNTRTIMMYIVGSNLEYDSGIVTADLASLDTNRINLENTNVIVYTGGTKSWKNNFVSNEENAIFELTKDGFKKVKTYEKLNMGSPETLSEFMNYAYTNYPAGHYNIVFYDHGGAIDGAIYDDFSGDNLTLEDFSKAMELSPFNTNNKLDAVLFRTCLNGTLEVAKLFEPYSDYIVFSEEISYGSPLSNVLSFINNLDIQDNGEQFGIKFVDSYKKQMQDIDSFGTMGVTYSVVDLSKVNKVVEELDKYVKKININTSYDQVSKVRANLYQYGKDSPAYDTVDLYTFINELSKYTNVSSDSLLKSIKDAVVYNYTNIKESNGLSIYFPYNGKNKRYKYLDVYKKLSFSENYSKFINQFFLVQSGKASNAFSFSKNEMNLSSNKEVSITLTKEQLSKLSYVKYAVFKRNAEHPNYYQIIYSSDDPIIREDGVLTTQIKDNIMYVDDPKNLITLDHSKNGSFETYRAVSILSNPSLDIFDSEKSKTAYSYFGFEGETPRITAAKVFGDNDERIDGTLLNLDDYSTIRLYFPNYKIFDKKGNFTLDFESAPETHGYEGNLNEIKFNKISIDKIEEELYVVFIIHDTNDEVYTSNVMKVGK